MTAVIVTAGVLTAFVFIVFMFALIAGVYFPIEDPEDDGYDYEEPPRKEGQN